MKGCRKSLSMEKETLCSPLAKRTPCANLSKRATAPVDLDWKEFVKHDPRYKRPAEVDLLIGDPSKAKKILAGNQKSDFTSSSASWLTRT